jgi:hypothetical protein
MPHLSVTFRVSTPATAKSKATVQAFTKAEQLAEGVADLWLDE